MKITDKIHLLKLDFEISISPEIKLQRFVNSIVIFGEKITIIDTGVQSSKDLIFEYIVQNNRQPSEIEKIILSHAHPDHIGSAADIKEVTGCRVFAHEAEKTWAEHIEKQYVERPVPGFYNLVDRSVTIDGFLGDGDVLKADENITLEFLHSPGHSKGSLNILFREDNILFTADSIPLKGDIPNYDSFPELMESLRKIRDNNNFSVLLTSWTAPILNLTEAYRLIKEGEVYLMQIDAAVRESYNEGNSESYAACRAVIQKLGLPPFLVNPLTDKAFKSHLVNSAK